MHDLSLESRVESFAEWELQDLHVLLVALGAPLRLGEALREEKVRAAGQKSRPVDDTERGVSGGDQPRLFRQLAACACQRLFAFGKRSRRHLPRRYLPCMA